MESSRFVAICPHGGLSWWSDRICPSFDAEHSAERWLLNDVLTLFAPELPVMIAGVGMGGQGALRIAFKHPQRFPIVASIDAAIDHYEVYWQLASLSEMYASPEHCRQDSAALHIHPVRQPSSIRFAAEQSSRWYRGNDRLHEKLSALGVSHSFEQTSTSLQTMLEWAKNAVQIGARRLL